METLVFARGLFILGFQLGTTALRTLDQKLFLLGQFDGLSKFFFLTSQLILELFNLLFCRFAFVQ